MNSLPSWQQLPDLDLYLDQVLLYINQQTRPFLASYEKPLTASMVNNYVKHGYIPKPSKKKYNRSHLARLIILSICKTIFPIADIQEIIDVLKEKQEAADLYNAFVECFSGIETAEQPLILQKACQTIQSYQETLALIPKLKGETNEPKF
ncbi:DUF1836 domain-containing protein [Streptococcus acidominimus]|uniref:DUF1836 domain-containing protein n=1 Tax=Streptococcus acidominimus TaxID=1326 RepID=A0A1Q8EFL3_STRAI|nr:DUF1836 domain-containing protein [Streptococcus acidominimus]MBF0848182.1 DUF1836 domain-containing protein [Streptococcus danieliae]MBF0818500.1 DUF1836 domain-containing protein [Streptococcus acidominimus]MBF0838240.1 DUF1836 domain-containing protein [Streptococcus acidominimus]OLF50585.1 hypothetical protein BU200_01610 [Streptococcus acidominimus]TFU31140.1 DUF1836 domain-containing protein [Streptococcus acidominimus]